MPKAVVDKLNAAMADVLANPTVMKRLEDLGVGGRKMSPADFTAFVQKQVAEWAPAVKASGAKLD
jgi:tripartite-type tricarboxylate transporter receptor subunit TctC